MAEPELTQPTLTNREPRFDVSPDKPYAFHHERERSHAGDVLDVATIFLTNRECPFDCVMCDLWKHTLRESVAPGAIPRQIRHALDSLPPARVVKLYNSGNFFDAKAIPPSDHDEIAEIMNTFESVIIENHPKLCSDVCLRFRDRIHPSQLEIALGLETCHEPTLLRLHKGMTLADFDRAAAFLGGANIRMRAFVLLGLPFMSPEDSLVWAVRSVEHAANQGVSCVSIIPTRAETETFRTWRDNGDFREPTAQSIETVMSESLKLNINRVFVDLWDANRFFHCPECREARIARLREMNDIQKNLPPILCARCD